MDSSQLLDPVLSAALSVRQRTCALLLGSGVSQAAEVPTGWDVVLLLITALARTRGSEIPEDPAAWYENEYGSQPTYDGVMRALAPAPGDRAALLRPYFEPTEEERERGAKQPTAAHRAIAQLVAAGHLKAIITPNFDRLMERAIEAEGISPVVVSTAAVAKEVAPLHQVPALVVKVHGDYLDVGTKNTAEELDQYDVELNRLLDRILEDYGLIVAGWSAGWDTALRDAVMRSPNRRYATYWLTKSEPHEEAKRLISHRQAVLIGVTSADEFFVSLREKVAALDELSAPHPLSVATAVASLKRMIPRPDQRIRLADLVSDVTRQAIANTGPADFPAGDAPEDWPSAFQGRLRAYEAATRTVQHMLAAGAYHGDVDQAVHWRRSIEALANARLEGNGQSPWLELLWYPALLGWYSVGIAAVSAEKYETLASVSRAQIRTLFSNEYTAADLHAWSVFRTAPDGSWFGRGRGSIAGPSWWLETALRDALRPHIANDDDYERAFDRWEYLLTMMAATDRRGDPRGPLGRYAWRRVNNRGERIIEVTTRELETQGDSWPPLASGLLRVPPTEAQEFKKELDENLRRMGIGFY